MSEKPVIHTDKSLITEQAKRISELEAENKRLISVLMHISVDSHNETPEQIRECAHEGLVLGLDYTEELLETQQRFKPRPQSEWSDEDGDCLWMRLIVHQLTISVRL